MKNKVFKFLGSRFVVFLLLSLSVVLTFVSCSSLSNYYVELDGSSGSVGSGSVGSYAGSGKPVAICTSDMEGTTSTLINQGYVPIGTLSYNGAFKDNMEDQLIKLCKQKGASVVLYSYEILGVTEDSSVSIDPVFTQYTKTYESSSVTTYISFPLLSGATFTFGSGPEYLVNCSAVFFRGTK